MNKLTLTIVKSTKSETSGNFVTKLVTETVVDLGILGNKSTKRTYYISAPNEVAVNETVDLDMDMFDVTPRPYTFTDEQDNEVTIDCKWLHLKATT